MDTPLPLNEAERLDALHSYAVLDTPAELAFDRITQLAARLFNVPVALVTLIEEERQWFKSRFGVDICETGRDVSFCAHAILHDEVMVVPDMTRDPRFATNPLVTGGPEVRFYAGAPLITPGGFALGTLCILDVAPRAPLSDEQCQTLADLAAMVVDEFELRKAFTGARQAEAARQETEAHYQMMVDTCPDAIVTIDTDSFVLSANGAVAKIFGYAPDELVGQSLEILMPEYLRHLHEAAVQRYLSTGIKHLSWGGVEVPGLHRDGHEIALEISFGEFVSDGKRIFTGFMRDISERKREQAELQRALEAERASQAYLQAILDNSPAVIYIKDTEGCYKLVNRQFEELSHLNRSSIIGKTDAALFPEEAAVMLRQSDLDLLAAGVPLQVEESFAQEDGLHTYFTTKFPLFGADGTPYAICGISSDITTRKQAETALQEQKNILESILTSMGNGVVVTDTSGELLLMNPSAARIINPSTHKMLPDQPTQAFGVFYADTKVPVPSAELPLVQAVYGNSTEAALYIRNDHVPEGVYVNVAGTPLRDETGTLRGSVTVFDDVTDFRREQDALKQRELELRLALTAGRMGIWTWDAASDTFTWERGSAGGAEGGSRTGSIRRFLKFVHPDERAHIHRLVKEAVKGGDNFYVEFRTNPAAGDVRWLMGQGRVVQEAGKAPRLIGIAMDITARKQADEALRESEETLKTIVATSPDVITILELDGTIRWESEAIFHVLGHTPEEIAGKNVFGFVHPDDVPHVVEKFQAAVEQKYQSQIRFRFRHADGHWVILEANGRVITDTEGGAVGVVVVSRDVTEQARVDEIVREAKEKAEQANRAKSEFLSRMSHELRTPMNAILGFAQILEMDLLSEDQDESVQHILKGGHHLLELINEVLDITRIEAGRLSFSLEPVSVVELVQETLDLVYPLADQRQIQLPSLRVLDQEAETFLLADRQRLKQVFLNLLANAVKYNRAGGRVEVRFSAAAGRVRVSVTDTGIGIAAHQMDELFAPFHRLHPDQADVEGTGLGLVLSKHLVEAMGGSIGVESTLDEGSTFWVELPVVASPTLHLSEQEPLAFDTAGPDCTVLYIEDNLSNLKLVEHILLRRPNVKLHVAMQGQMGLDLAREHRPDLILMDLHLPDMHGSDLLGQLRADLRTDAIPVVVVSADATPNQIDKLLAAGASSYLTKPLDIQKFLRVLDQTLLAQEGIPSL